MGTTFKGIKRIAFLLTAVLILASVPTGNFCALTVKAIGEDEQQWLDDILSEFVEENEIMATVYLCNELPVKLEPAQNASTVVTVQAGQTVYIQSMDFDSNWVYVKIIICGQTYYGYVPYDNLVTSDERFLWVKEASNPAPMMLMSMMEPDDDQGQSDGGQGQGDGDQGDGGQGDGGQGQGDGGQGDGDNGQGGEGQGDGGQGQGDGDQGDAGASGDGNGAGQGDGGEAGQTPQWSADVDCFPESYKASLQTLKDAHPSWVFVPMNTGVTLETAVTKELGDKSLISSSAAECNKDGLYGQKWYYATDDILAYYMDPRNWLTENSIFQFELLTYNESYHTEAALDSYLSNTFMRSGASAPGTDMNYSFFIHAIGKEQNVSPFHMAARIIQEQGINGNSSMINGTYPGYEGYYNYFNYKATGTTNEQVITNGLSYAKSQGWNSAYTSIRGGTMLLKSGYISKGQDTLYLEKFNVNPTASNAMYSHQYQQNIQAPSSEASSVKKMYQNAGALDNSFVFKIPVYENMTETPAPKSTESLEVKLSIPAGYGATSIWIDGVECTPYKRNGLWIVEAPDNGAQVATMYKYNASNVPVGMYIWSLNYNEGAYKATAETDLEDLLSYHGFSIRITGKTGIRCKMGITSQNRELLTTSGINGYTLQEYGTVIQLNKNRAAYPMVLKGAKTAFGMSYGTDSDGQKVDKIFEQVDGRLRYTAVLTDLPVTQYKEDYAFRAYAKLSKGGKDIIIYGPVVAKNMYDMAGQLLNSGKYSVGSSTYVFLEGLRESADGA